MIDPIREEQSDSQSRSVRKGDLAEEKEEVDEQIGRM